MNIVIMIIICLQRPSENTVKKTVFNFHPAITIIFFYAYGRGGGD